LNKPDNATADKTMISIVLVFVSIVCLCLFIAPDYSKASIQSMNYFITSNLGFIYIWIVLISIVLCLYLGAGQYGSIQLGTGKKSTANFHGLR
jgi:BCCT family betaine/carnitine transporter